MHFYIKYTGISVVKITFNKRTHLQPTQQAHPTISPDIVPSLVIHTLVSLSTLWISTISTIGSPHNLLPYKARVANPGPREPREPRPFI